jgi:hypothetical protein
MRAMICSAHPRKRLVLLSAFAESLGETEFGSSDKRHWAFRDLAEPVVCSPSPQLPVILNLRARSVAAFVAQEAVDAGGF